MGYCKFDGAKRSGILQAILRKDGYINPSLPVSVNLLGTEHHTPPRQASPVTPPAAGYRRDAIAGGELAGTATTPSGFACHPSTGGELLTVKGLLKIL